MHRLRDVHLGPARRRDEQRQQQQQRQQNDLLLMVRRPGEREDQADGQDQGKEAWRRQKRVHLLLSRQKIKDK